MIPQSTKQPYRRGFSRLAVGMLPVLATGCDPVLNVYGSFFPAWVVCLLAGVVLASGLRFVFLITGLERNLGPLILVYPALGLLLGCLTWMLLFAR